MITNKEALIDNKGRALCLMYRNGKRCRRLATKIVSDNNCRARCEECAKNTTTLQTSNSGFTVQSVGFGGWTNREYVSCK